MKFERFIRKLPAILLVAAAADFLKQCLYLASTWHSVQYFDALSPDNGLYLKIVFGLLEQVLGVVLYPFGWVVSAMSMIVLLSIYDKGRAENA